MTFWRFMKDRLLLVLACFAALFVALLVVWLDLGIGQRYLYSGSLTYVFVLGGAVILVGLIYDYSRQRRWFHEMKNAEENASSNDFTLCLQHPETQEQERVHGLISRQYSAYMDELLTVQKNREQHLHFTNQWVHHMKTPVSVLHLISQQTPQPLSLEETEQLLRSIAEETDRLARGLDMMLHTARMEKFDLDLHVTGLSLQHVIRQVINQNKKALIRYQIYPKVTPGDTMVESDEKWLAFILTQLVTNAIKYMKDKEGAKSLQFTVQQTGGAVQLRVQDEGVGIEPHDIPRIFDAFFTGENGRREGDATGMGLYLVKQVCGKLGHTISVESEPHVGTTFTLGFHSDGIHRI